MSLYEYSATLERIIDGDTVVMLVDLGFSTFRRDTFRFYGINAPEHTTPEGQAAITYINTLIKPGDVITTKTYKDKTEKYGRMLATLTRADGLCINDDMVKSGHAVAYFGGAR
jgi:micrococcal nuclease